MSEEIRLLTEKVVLLTDAVLKSAELLEEFHTLSVELAKLNARFDEFPGKREKN